MIVEGCYIPFDWAKDFPPDYLRHIRYRCLIMSEAYIRANFQRIRDFANAIEHRLDDSDLSADDLIRDNNQNLQLCKEHGCEYLLIDGDYSLSPEDVF
jgi:predicted RNA-binding Zn ribbon-like protein